MKIVGKVVLNTPNHYKTVIIAVDSTVYLSTSICIYYYYFNNILFKLCTFFLLFLKM